MTECEDSHLGLRKKIEKSPKGSNSNFGINVHKRRR